MPDIRITLDCTLKDFYCGSRKMVNYERQVVDLDGRTVRQTTSCQEVFVRPGMKEGTEFKLAGKGNVMPRRPASDLYIKLVITCQDNTFKRINENDLLYTHKASLCDVLRCCPVDLVTFDDRKLIIPIEGTNPGYAMQVAGEGMPIYEGLDLTGQRCQKRGNLYIKFCVSFPKTLTKQQKDQVASILAN